MVELIQDIRREADAMLEGCKDKANGYIYRPCTELNPGRQRISLGVALIVIASGELYAPQDSGLNPCKISLCSFNSCSKISNSRFSL